MVLKTLSVAAAVVAAGLVAFAPHAAESADTVLKVRAVGDLKIVDPIFSTDYLARNHGYMVYDTLFAVDGTFAPKPQMVERWETSPNGTVWTFRLRPGQTFHDGAKVTSADVVASIRRWGSRDGFGQLLMARTAALDAIDEDTFRLTLRQPWSFVLDALAKPGSQVPFIMPARVASAPSDQPITDTTGSGPFVMVREEWNPGSKIVYARNPRYMPRAEPADSLSGGKRVNFDRVEWVILPDAATSAAALRNGEIDLFQEVPPDLAPTLAGRADVTLAPNDNVGNLFIVRFNSIEAPFDNPKLRQAVRYAIDQSNYLGAYASDPKLVAACPSFFGCASLYTTDAGWQKPDLERAKALVKESGYDGKPAVILDLADYFIHAQALVAADMLKKIGVNTELFSADWGTITSRRAQKTGWSLIVSSPTGIDVADPLSNFALRTNCDKAWFGWPCDEEIERLRNAFTEAPDLAARKKIAEQIQLRAWEVGPFFPAGVIYSIRGSRANLTGILSTPVPVYWNIARR